MTLNRCGFFDDMPTGEASALLRNVSSESPRPNEEEVARYLEGGTQILAVPGAVSDLLSDPEQIIGAPHVFTDGEWAWTADVVYYVRKYHIALPDEFLERMRKCGWQCPTVGDVEALELEGWTA